VNKKERKNYMKAKRRSKKQWRKQKKSGMHANWMVDR